MNVSLAHSEACERNKGPILQYLLKHFASINHVLEIGSGTGQHAVYFSANLPHLIWQTSDRLNYIAGINQRLLVEGKVNIKPPIEIDVAQYKWGLNNVDAVFTANTFHIMSKGDVAQFFTGAEKTLVNNGLIAIYGPFKYNGKFTSQSNESFDQALKAGVSHMGIRDFEWINGLAVDSGFQLVKDYKMPANNQLLIFEKRSL